MVSGSHVNESGTPGSLHPPYYAPVLFSLFICTHVVVWNDFITLLSTSKYIQIRVVLGMTSLENYIA